MATQAKPGLESFSATFEGRTLLPGHSDYEEARAVWNGAIDRKPAVIACCTTREQVAQAIAFSRRAGLELSVRGGGHNYAGHAVCEAGVMIHLGAMNRVTVDPQRRRAVCGGGATWADLDAATQQHGLATPGGFISHTGVAGLTLGGGIGWLTKKAGLSCDNLLAAELVTADSRVLRASKEENPELLWALRGGGGNFGVVTSFEFALHPVGPMVNLGLFFFPMENGAESLRFARGYLRTLPEQATGFLAIGMNAPPAPFVPEPFQGRLGHALLVASFGSTEEHVALLEPIHHAVRPLFELVTPLPYVQLQQLFDTSAKWGTYGYEKALYLEELSDDAIAVITEMVPRKSAPLSFCPTFTLDGAFHAVGETDTAFGGSRQAGFVFNIDASAPDRALYETDRAWVRSFWEAMRPHALGSGGYVNFQADVDEARTRASYGPDKYRLLAAIKDQYDPQNVFHLNANIKPAPGGVGVGAASQPSESVRRP